MSNTKNKKTNKKTKKTASKKEAKNKKTFKLPKINFKELFKNKSFIAILILIAAFGLGMLLRGTLIVATVNGKPISRFNIISQLEKAYGQTTLESTINQALIEQALKEENITISQEEVDAQMNTIEQSIIESGQDFEDLLEQQGLTKEMLEKDIRTQLSIEKLLSDKITVTEEEIDSYIDQNAESFPEELDTTTQEFRQQVKDTLEQQKLSTEFSTWLEEIKNKANINYFKDY